MIDKEEWTEVETVTSDNEENKVEFEIEAEAEAPPTTKEASPSTTEEVSSPSEKPEELEGIETKGAQKRIRHLIKQRKDLTFNKSIQLQYKKLT